MDAVTATPLKPGRTGGSITCGPTSEPGPAGSMPEGTRLCERPLPVEVKSMGVPRAMSAEVLQSSFLPVASHFVRTSCTWLRSTSSAGLAVKK